MHYIAAVNKQMIIYNSNKNTKHFGFYQTKILQDIMEKILNLYWRILKRPK